MLHPHSAAWASVTSWILKSDNPTVLANHFQNPNSASTSLLGLPTSLNQPQAERAIRCTVPSCSCECFSPGKVRVRYCDRCAHGWVPHALDKLGVGSVSDESEIESVRANVVFDIASLVLYGCQGLPVRLKMLLDRLFATLHKDQVDLILRAFGWNHHNYCRGYILQESSSEGTASAAFLDRWCICSPEEEPLVLRQFLRFSETRDMARQLLTADVAIPTPLPFRLPTFLPSAMIPEMSGELRPRHSRKRTTDIATTTQSQPPPSEQPYSYAHLSQLQPLPKIVSDSGSSPLNKLESMRPFDFRKLASGPFGCSGESSEKSSPDCGPKPRISSYASPTEIAMSGSCSELGSEEECVSALNLSKDSVVNTQQASYKHSRKALVPMKRNWPSTTSLQSGLPLPLDLGTQLVNPATGKKRVRCNVCLKTFCDKGALKIHFSAVHLREMHKCTVHGCNMMFSSRRSRNRHSANPNPKLHSPHLRRKISPHDGRSANAHPILLRRPSAANPLHFPSFPPLLSASGHVGQRLTITFETASVTSQADRDSDEYPKTFSSDDDEEGIMVDGGCEGDEYDDEMEEVDEEEEHSKLDRTTPSPKTDGKSSDSPNGVPESTKAVENTLSSSTPKNPRQRKSLNPTKCSFLASRQDDLTPWPLPAVGTDFSSECLNLSKNAPPYQTAANSSPLSRSSDGVGGVGTYSGSGGSAYSSDSDSYFANYDEVEEENSDGGDNKPKACSTCGKVFQNHFGVKAHFQNVHLKLKHKCVIEGCAAAFPSKRSRDRHSSNSNLHRKLLSTGNRSRSSSVSPAPESSAERYNSSPTRMSVDATAVYAQKGPNL